MEEISGEENSGFSPEELEYLSRSLEQEEVFQRDPNPNGGGFGQEQLPGFLNMNLDYGSITSSADPKVLNPGSLYHHLVAPESVTRPDFIFDDVASTSLPLPNATLTFQFPSQIPVSLTSSASSSIPVVTPLVPSQNIPSLENVNKSIADLRNEFKALESSLRAELKEREGAFYQVLNKSLAMVTASLTEKISSFASSVGKKLDAEDSSTRNLNDDDEWEDSSEPQAGLLYHLLHCLPSQSS